MEYDVLEQKVKMAPIGTAKLGIENMRQLMHHLGDPQEKLQIIHIGGTNGKGSTAKMTANILQEAGYKVGLFTSPSLVDFNERIQINQEPISDEELEAVIETIHQKLPDDFVTTQFEMFTALAWVAFYAEAVDIVVMEVGLGGRLDATNIITSPVVSVITKIALDHVHILGDTLPKIATEKSGIIKANRPVITYPQADEVVPVLEQAANKQNSSFLMVNPNDISYELSNDWTQTFKYKGESYRLRLLEEHQIYNAAVVIEIIQALIKQGWAISSEPLQNGLFYAEWAARFERIPTENGDIIIDGSHNVDGMTGLFHNLTRYYPHNYRIGVIGMVADKDITHVLDIILPAFDAIIVTTPDSHRALPARELAEAIQATGQLPKDRIYIQEDFYRALNEAQQLQQDQDDAMICLFGSFYFIGHLRQQLLN